MAFLTADDLRTDALFLANEPTDSTSQFYSKAADYINFVLKTLVGGGTIGDEDLEPVDFPWARKYPRPYIRHLAAWNIDSAISVTMTLDSSTVTPASMAASLSLLNYRLIVPSSVNTPAFAATVTAHTAGTTTVTIDRTYPAATVSSADIFAVPVYYALPSDFLRFCGALIPNGGSDHPVNIISPDALDERYPLKNITQATVPAYASLTGFDSTNETQFLRFSHYVEDPLDYEYEYIFAPSDISGSTAPLMPASHRRVLSYGAAVLMLLDKEDTAAKSRLAEFAAIYRAMVREVERNASAGSRHAGELYDPGQALDTDVPRDDTGRILMGY